ncbi:MAG: hypothetical protein PHG36_01435 [Dehalococcoidia bacterium]|nr:hypothetical protein [Dehalococcoidia bacterium]
MKRVLFIITILVLLIQLCIFPSPTSAKDDPIPACASISTLPATDIYSSQATLRANITSLGDCAWVDVSFQYGTSRGVYTNVTSTVRYASTGTISAVVANLNPCTMYYFQPVARGPVLTRMFPPAKWFLAGVNAGGALHDIILATEVACITYGQELSFGTGGCTQNLFNTGGGSSGGGNVGGMAGTTTTTTPVPLANIRVQNVSLSASKVGVGEQVEVRTTVSNNSNSNGSSKITLYVNGQEVTYQGITLNAGEVKQLSFNVFRNEPGVYQVVVNGFPAGSFTVDYFTNNHALIYAIIALFVIVIGGLLFLLSRRIT